MGRQGSLNTLGRAGLGSRPRRSFLLGTEMTLGNGYLGSRIDEERSEMRYVV